MHALQNLKLNMIRHVYRSWTTQCIKIIQSVNNIKKWEEKQKTPITSLVSVQTLLPLLPSAPITFTVLLWKFTLSYIPFIHALKSMPKHHPNNHRTQRSSDINKIISIISIIGGCCWRVAHIRLALDVR